MRLEQLHYLLELYRTRSFSKAAEKVFITQPSLSTAISGLEEELGVRLFERTRSGIYPTPMGEAIVAIAQELVDCEMRIFKTAKESEPQDKIRLLTIPALSPGVLLEALRIFRKKYPDVNLLMHEYPPPTIIGEAVRPISDEPGTFCFASIPPKTKEAILAELEKSHIGACFAYRDTFVCHISKEHPLAEKKALSMEDILSYPGISLNLLTRKPIENTYYKLHDIGLSGDIKKLRSNINIEVDTLASLKHLIMRGDSLTILPRMIGYHDRDYIEGNIITRPLANLDIPIEYYILYSTHYPLKPMEIEFLEEVSRHFKDILSNR